MSAGHLPLSVWTLEKITGMERPTNAQNTAILGSAFTLTQVLWNFRQLTTRDEISAH